MGFSMQPNVVISNNIIYCSSQAGPMYDNAGERQAGVRTTGVTSSFTHAETTRGVGQPIPISSVPTIAELRNNQRLAAEVQAHYRAVEEAQIGNISVNKKSRGLLRAGG
jgi:hypothetical protein